MISLIVPVLAILLALAPSATSDGMEREDFVPRDFDTCDLGDKGQRCWLADRMDDEAYNGVRVVYQEMDDASCPALRRQKSKRVLEECKTDTKDYCYWMKNANASNVRAEVAGCICKAFLDKHGVPFKNGCFNISAPLFEGRGEVCLCDGTTKDYKRDGVQQKDKTGCNAKGLGEVPELWDVCGSGWIQCQWQVLFVSLLAAIILF